MTFSRCIWVLIAVMAAFTVAGCLLTGLRVAPASLLTLVVPFAVLGATWWVYSTVRPDARVRGMAEGFVQILLVLIFGTVMSYAAIALTFPLVDDKLLAIDLALGIDRRIYLDFINGQRLLHNALVLAYFTLMPQFVIVPVVLFFANQMQRLQQFTFASGVALFATVLISIFTPALSTTYLDLGLPVGAPVPEGLGVHLPVMEKLRSGVPFLMQLDQLEGLLTFPSFHTIGALLFIWATWRVPVVRWLSLVLNAALIAATPVIGTHYFIDVAAGFLVAWLAVYAAIRLSARASSPHHSLSATGSTAPAQ
ncbi:MAG: phosphatase PAP2 family protein [Pseudolabrys sp.]|nr:phosphatase PAP2 family protein [Pseudolabrys sp.]